MPTRRPPLRATACALALAALAFVSYGGSDLASADMRLAPQLKPGPVATMWFNADNPKFKVKVANAELDEGLVLHWQRNPIVEIRFTAAAGTQYVAECAFEPMSSPSSLQYTLQWSSNLPSEPPFAPQKQALRVQGGHWFQATIPKRNVQRQITVRASAFGDTKRLLMCQLTPYT